MHNINKRQLEIVKILQEKKFVTTSFICKELNVTTRTLRSDLQYLKTVYPNIVTHVGNKGGVEWVNENE